MEFRLRALNQLVPYLKLVEREKLRVPTKSEEAYNEFYNSDEVNRLFDDLIVDKLAISQILLALEEKPLSTAEISEVLGLNPSEVSRHMNSSSRQGLRQVRPRAKVLCARVRGRTEGGNSSDE